MHTLRGKCSPAQRAKEGSTVMSSQDCTEDQPDGPTSRGSIRRYLYVLLAVLPFLYISGSARLLYARWARIPDLIPIHYDASGNVDTFVEKGVWGVYGLLIVGLAIAAVMTVFSIVAVAHSSKPAAPREKTYRQLAAAKGNLVLLAAMHWITAYLCYLSVCRALAPDLVGYRFYVLIGALVLAGLVFVGLYFAIRPKLLAHTDAGEIETGRVDDPAAHWKWGLFYWNPKDPSVVVEHRYGMGVTLNLASPIPWLLLSALALIVVGSIALAVAAG